MRYELSDYEWTAIKPMLPNKPRGIRRVNDRRVLNGIFRVLRSGAPWRDPPLRALHDLLQSLHLIDRLIEAFAPNRGNLIAVPVSDGRRGNPVLWSRRFFYELMTLDGDIDTPQALEAALRG